MGNYLNGDTRPPDKQYVFRLLILCLAISTVLIVAMLFMDSGDAEGSGCRKHYHCTTTTTVPETTTTLEVTTTTAPPTTTTTAPDEPPTLIPPLVITRELPAPAVPVGAEPEFTG